MELKKCSKCKIEKEITEFSKDKSRKSGLTSHCKQCKNEYGKKWNKENKEHKKEYNKKYYKPKIKTEPLYILVKKCAKCKVKKDRSEFTKDRRLKSGLISQCKQCKKEWREGNKEYAKKWNKENKEHSNNYAKTKYKTDSLFKLKTNLRNTVNRYLKNGKSKRTEAILGMTYKAFKERLGECDSNTHLDHIIPQNWAKNEEELYTLNHYSNFQLLTAEENISKGDRFSRVENVRRVFKEHNNKKAIAKIILRNYYKII